MHPLLAPPDGASCLGVPRALAPAEVPTGWRRLASTVHHLPPPAPPPSDPQGVPARLIPGDPWSARACPRFPLAPLKPSKQAAGRTQKAACRCGKRRQRASSRSRGVSAEGRGPCSRRGLGALWGGGVAAQTKGVALPLQKPLVRGVTPGKRRARPTVRRESCGVNILSLVVQ